MGLLLAPPPAIHASPREQERAAGEWIGAPRVIAVGDLHGSYEKALRLLQGVDLVDRDGRWIGGNQHLVIAGDMIDRGSGDREVMDLMRRLQKESEKAGGRVHVLLGNHETMNLMRDLRYVNALAYRAWAEDETKSERRDAWRVFAKERRGTDTESNLSIQFQELYPPGYFARLRSFEPDGEYGSWLLGLPAMVKINQVVYVHGGVTMETAALGIGEVNRRLADELRRHLEARAYLEREEIVTPLMTFGEIRWLAADGMKRRGQLAARMQQAIGDLDATFNSVLLASEGPLWYRGNSFEDERIEREMLERSLELLGAKAMVVAHSPTPNQRITSRFHGQLFRVDHDIGRSETLQALVIEAEEIVVLEASTKQVIRPLTELPIGRYEPRGARAMSDDELEQFLARAEVTDWRYLGRGTTRPRLLDLQIDGESQRGIFKTVEETSPDGVVDRYEHELAAYRLDRKMSLDLVPVTVLREIDGQRGSLQSWVEGAVDQEAASSYELELFRSDETARQLARGKVFDALIGNSDRKPNDILRLVDRDRVFLIDHSKAFSASPEIDWRPDEASTIDSSLLAALRDLDRESLDAELGDLLSGRQIEALLARRDRILDRAVRAAESAEPREPRAGSAKGGAGDTGP